MPFIYLLALQYSVFINDEQRMRALTTKNHHPLPLVISNPNFLAHFAPRITNLSTKRFPLTMPYFKIFEDFSPFSFHYATSTLHLQYDGGFTKIEKTEKEMDFFSTVPESRLFFLGRFVQLRELGLSNVRREVDYEKYPNIKPSEVEILNLPILTNLEVLDFEYIYGYGNQIENMDSIFRGFPEHKKRLRELNLGPHARTLLTKIDAEKNDLEKPSRIFSYISASGSLRKLSVAGGFSHEVTVSNFDFLALLPTNLTHLVLTGVTDSTDLEQFPDILNEAFEKSPRSLLENLRILDLSYNEYFPPASARFVKNFENLEILKLRECVALVQEEFCRESLRHVLSLKEVILDYCSHVDDECLKYISGLPFLEVVTFDGCHNRLTKDGIQYLTEFNHDSSLLIGRDKKPSFLKRLDLRGVHLVDDCLKAIGKGKRTCRLETLEMRDSPEITDRGMRDLFDVRNKQNDEKKNNNDDEKYINHDGDDEFKNQLQNTLTFLDISQCQKLTDRTCFLISDLLAPNLKHLKISCNDGMGKAGVAKIAEKLLPNLKSVEAIMTSSKAKYDFGAFSWKDYRGLMRFNRQDQDWWCP